MPVADIPTLNRQLAQKLVDDAKTNPQSPYRGKLVGIANGRVEVVADDWDDLARRLEQVEPDPSQTFAVEVGRDYSEVNMIWGLANATRPVAVAPGSAGD
jgi:hypothetical protein